MKYTETPAASVPNTIRFDVPGDCQGQIIEVAYGGTGRHEHGPGAQWKRVVDRSLAPSHPDRETYYRIVAPVVAADSYQGMTNAARRADERAAALPIGSKERRAALKTAREAWAEVEQRYGR
jgi:hypothetical protein